MDNQIDNLAKKIIDDSVKRSNQIIWVFIAGKTCSGKTFLAKELSKKLKKCTLIHLDDFFKNYHDPSLPRFENGLPNYELPESYRLENIYYAIKFIRTGHGSSVFLPVYDIRLNSKVSDRFKKVHQIVIIEGLHAISIAEEEDLEGIKVFVDTPADVRLARRIKKDSKRFDVKPEIITEAFWSRIEPIQSRLVTPQKLYANHFIEWGV